MSPFVAQLSAIVRAHNPNVIGGVVLRKPTKILSTS